MAGLDYHGHCVSLLKEHLVICPKYRGKVLVGPVADYADFIIRRVCRLMGVTVIKLKVNPDHVHILFQYPPYLSSSFIKKKIKGVSSRMLRQAYPHLIRWCPKNLWSRSAFHGSVGHGSDVVERYIETQQY